MTVNERDLAYFMGKAAAFREFHFEDALRSNKPPFPTAQMCEMWRDGYKAEYQKLDERHREEAKKIEKLLAVALKAVEEEKQQIGMGG